MSLVLHGALVPTTNALSPSSFLNGDFGALEAGRGLPPSLQHSGLHKNIQEETGRLQGQDIEAEDEEDRRRRRDKESENDRRRGKRTREEGYKKKRRTIEEGGETRGRGRRKKEASIRRERRGTEGEENKERRSGRTKGEEGEKRRRRGTKGEANERSGRRGSEEEENEKRKIGRTEGEEDEGGRRKGRKEEGRLEGRSSKCASPGSGVNVLAVMSSIILTVELIINIVINSNNNNNNNNNNDNNNNNNNRNENMNMVMTENMNDNMAGRGIDVQNAAKFDRSSSKDVPRDAPPPQGTAKRDDLFARPQDVNGTSISTLESHPKDISPLPSRRSSSKTSPSSRTPRQRCHCKKKRRKLDSIFKSLSKFLR